jgi:hypothetical protein
VKNLNESFEDFVNESNSNECLKELDKFLEEDVDENFDPNSFILGQEFGRQMHGGGGGEVSVGVGIAIIAASILVPAAAMITIAQWDNIKDWFKKKKVQRLQKELNKHMSPEQLDDILNVLKIKYPETYRLITSNKAKGDIIKGLNNIKSQKGIEDTGEKGKDILKHIDPKFMDELVRRLKTRSRAK